MLLRPLLFLLAALAVLPAGSAGCGAPEAPAAPDDLRDVRILRDRWGVPHVFGADDPDVAFGLAYAHAEDDFATIQKTLLAARGRLASVEGRDAAPNDYFVALARVWDSVESGYERDLAPETRALCEAYAEGINLYASRHPEEVVGDWLPATGRDVVAGFVHKTPLFFGLHHVVQELLEEERPRRVSPRPEGPVAFTSGAPGLPIGSNAFAVAPSRSADGATRLAVNSHQPWEGPVAWYEVHLRSDTGLEMVGGVFPGTPVVLHGHNRHLGWAHTVNLPDLVDVYVLDVHPDDPNRYRVDGEWLELEVREAPIEVKLWGPLSWTFHREVLWSIFGPALRTDHGTYAMRWAGMGDVRAVEQWYRMGRATSREEWREAMRMQGLPSFNTVYADREGNIEYVYNARLPLRARGWDWEAYLPGDTREVLWTEYLPWDALPRVVDPPSGFVQNANSSPFRTTTGPGNPDPADFPPAFGIETTMTNRALRLLELLGGDPSITAAEFEAYKFDMAYSEASDVAGYVDHILAAPAPEDPLLRRAREVLRAWDLRTNPENLSAALGVLTLEPVVRAARRLARGEDVEVPDPRERFAEVARALHEAHGRLALPWRQVNRLRRGEVDLGLGGGPDILHAVYNEGLDEEGRVTGRAGDSLVLLVEWDEDGVRSRSIHQYGSATLDEESPHHADQAPLFVRRETKPVWLREAAIRANLERAYRPEDR